MSKKIRVDFSETEDIVISPDNERIKHEVAGVVSIHNPSSKEQIWATEMTVSNSENTNRLQPGSYEVGAIKPGEFWSRNYSLQDITPVLTLIEDIDTDFEKDNGDFERHTLLYNKETGVLFKITLKNVFGKKKIDNINLVKHLPDIAGEPQLLGEPKGEVLQEEDQIKWNLPELHIGDEAVLQIYIPCTPTSGEAVGAGEIYVTYEVENQNIIEPEPYLTSQTMIKPQVKPVEVAPDEWEVEVKFTGNEELDTRLEGFEVSQNGKALYKKPEGHNKVLAGGMWKDKFQMTSDGYPNLEKQVKYRPLWYVTRSIHSTIKKEEWVLPVLMINANKTLDPPECLSYARTDIRVSSVIENTGTGVISEAIYEEKIPPYLYLKPDTLMVLAGNEEVDEDRISVETQAIEDEDDPKLKESRPLITKVKFDKMTGVSPNVELKLMYVLHACKPIPKIEYPMPLSTTVRPNPLTKEQATDTVIWKNEEPALKIKFARRSYDISNDVKGGTHDGQFEVTINVENTGEVDIENIVLQQKLPPGFRFVDYIPKHLVCSQEEQVVKWSLPKLVNQGSVQISFTVETSESGAIFMAEEPRMIIKG
ncbi:MAG: hypothetical protein ACFFCZ_19075 [Promethearchaeota archaeon]